jgi:CO/xanthine dehydrogenase FAD-binding subunit
MKTAVSSLSLRRATTVDEALRILADEPRMPIAGATDVYVALNFGTLGERAYLDISALDELSSISERDDTLVIGALATYTDLIRSPVVAQRLPMAIDAARVVGGVQIQNRGTVGGNIANGSPAGDTLPVWAAVDAVVVVRSAGGERRVPFNEFYTGYRKSVLRRDELLVAVEVPRVEGRQWFFKVGTRAAQAISKIVVAGVRGEAVRLAAGSVAPTVVRLRATEHALSGGASIDDAVARVGDDVSPIDDIRSTADYRRRVTSNLVRRFWSETT